MRDTRRDNRERMATQHNDRRIIQQLLDRIDMMEHRASTAREDINRIGTAVANITAGGVNTSAVTALPASVTVDSPVVGVAAGRVVSARRGSERNSRASVRINWLLTVKSINNMLYARISFASIMRI